MAIVDEHHELTDLQLSDTGSGFQNTTPAFANRVQPLLTGCFLLVMIPLTIFTAYRLAGPNPRDQFELSLLTPQLDLDASKSPTTRFRLTNKSSMTVFLEQLDADYGCRIVLQSDGKRRGIASGEACEFESQLSVDHAFLLPRTKARIDIPVSVMPIIKDDQGNRFSLPIYYFEQTFCHRITASTDAVRLASHPQSNDAITSIRTVVLKTVGESRIESVKVDDSSLPDTMQLSVQYEPQQDMTCVVTTTVHSRDAVGSSPMINAALVILTSNTGEADSNVEIRIPIIIQPRWTT